MYQWTAHWKCTGERVHGQFRENILLWNRYVDDILVIWQDTINNNIGNLEEYVNTIHTQISFILEMETNNRINFLDLTIRKQQHGLAYEMYRNLTVTDIIISSNSHHAYSAKTSSFQALIHRMHSVPMKQENKYTEKKIILQIGRNNGYTDFQI